MAEEKADNVTMRIKIADSELEVTGPKEFVEKKIADFIELTKTKVLAPIPVTQILPPVAISSGESSPLKPLSPAQLFKKAVARTDVDRTLLAGYFLETFRKCDSFTAGEVKEVIREAKNNPPVNANDAVNSNIKKGFIMSAGDRDGRRAFVLTSDGEEAVNQMLQS